MAIKKARPVKAAKPVGRPTEYTDAVATLICSEVSSGRSLRSICADDGMPGRTTVFRWLGEHEIFRNQYEKAQRERTVAWAEELADIADEASAETVQKARLQIDTRKWLMSKMAPKKYGDRVVNEHTGANGGPIQSHTLILDPEKLKAMTSDELAALEAAIGKLHGSAGDGEGRTDAEGDAEAYSGAIDGGEGELAP